MLDNAEWKNLSDGQHYLEVIMRMMGVFPKTFVLY